MCVSHFFPLQMVLIIIYIGISPSETKSLLLQLLQSPWNKKKTFLMRFCPHPIWSLHLPMKDSAPRVPPNCHDLLSTWNPVLQLLNPWRKYFRGLIFRRSIHYRQFTLTHMAVWDKLCLCYLALILVNLHLAEPRNYSHVHSPNSSFPITWATDAKYTNKQSCHDATRVNLSN